MFDKLKKKIASKVFRSDRETVDPTSDIDVCPLDIHIGGLLAIRSNNDVIYDSCIRLPKNQVSVRDIGTFDIGTSKVWRVYISDDTMLQIIVDHSTSLMEECRLFRKVDTYLPTTPESWEEWEERASNFLFHHANKEYTRMDSWADPELDHAPLVSFCEVNQDETRRVVYTAMCFGRWLDEDIQVAEYLLATTEEHHVDTSPDTIVKACIYIGLDIDPNEIRVIY